MGFVEDFTCRPVLELRQYTLKPGQRDVLIELFDREFVESQDRCGAYVLGQFRDLDRPDRFVWLRGFDGMPERARALGAFYGGPVWKAHSRAANATMIDTDDVRLLRPAGGWRSLRMSPPGERLQVAGMVCPLARPAGRGLVAAFQRELIPALAALGVRTSALMVTEPARNTFPALPVIEGRSVLVWLGAHALGDPDWAGLIRRGLAARLDGEPQRLRLSPTARSLFRG